MTGWRRVTGNGIRQLLRLKSSSSTKEKTGNLGSPVHSKTRGPLQKATPARKNGEAGVAGVAARLDSLRESAYALAACKLARSILERRRFHEQNEKRRVRRTGALSASSRGICSLRFCLDGVGRCDGLACSSDRGNPGSHGAA